MSAPLAQFTHALQAFRAGNWVEAEWICQEIVRAQPTSTPALNLLGALAFQTGRLESAIAYYRQVISLNPNHFEAHSNLAVALHRQGDWQTAIHHFQQSLALNPRHAPTHFNLGNLRLQQGEIEAAISHYQQAVQLDPGYVKAHHNLAHALRQQGQLDTAIAHYEQVITLAPTNASAYSDLGNILLEQGQVGAAIVQYQKSLLFEPTRGEVHFNLGNALITLNQLESAISAYDKALMYGLERAEVHNNLGLALRESGQGHLAIAHFQRAIALQPDDPQTYINLGTAFHELHDLEGAIAQYQHAFKLAPQVPEAHLNCSLALLTMGDFEQGFAEYEWRFHLPVFQIPKLPGSRWDGSDCRGKTLLLYAEQGFGDTIQFIRYAPLLAHMGARVTVVCRPELLRLLTTVPGITRLLSMDEGLPESDLHVPLMSLPLVLKHQLATLPNQVPYLMSLMPTLAIPTTPKFKVGLVWASNALVNYRLIKSYWSRKSIPLQLFLPLQSVPEIEFYSLQLGGQATVLAESEFNQWIHDLTPLITDFADTAAIISCLDLVISVDTAVAHLAGAMGKPVWVLLPYAADWRWLLDREDSPWYPTMRLLRQDEPGNWAGVIDRVVAALWEMSEPQSKSW